jgi:CHAD domain-containing protein
MSNNHQELEWQFDTADLVRAEQWLRDRARVGDLQFHFAQAEAQVDAYYDSPDWRFYQAGYALRLRREGALCEATLKSFGTKESALRRRHEINEALDSTQDAAHALHRSAGEVGSRVRLVLGKGHLRRLFEVRSSRQRILLRSGGITLAEIALDDVTVAANRRRQPVQFNRVEIELQPNTLADGEARVRNFVSRFRKACGLQPATLSKFEAGLEAQGLHPAPAIDLAQPDAPEHAGDDPTMGDLAYAVFRQQFQEFLRRVPGSRLGEDPEDVHRIRVAARRLRAAMSLFRDYIPSEAQRLRAELGWAARVLGAVRDLDVQLARAREWHNENTALDANALRSLETLLIEQRHSARERALRAMNAARFSRMVDDMTALLRAGPGAATLAHKPARNEMPLLILKRYVKVREGGDAIDADSPAEELHALRIQCKRLRYALEFSTVLYGKPMRDFLPRLTALQDVLGDHQDAYVAIDQLRLLGLTQPALPETTLEAFSDISDHYAAQARELRDKFPKAYRRLKGKAWQQVQRALDEGMHQ